MFIHKDTYEDDTRFVIYMYNFIKCVKIYKPSNMN